MEGTVFDIKRFAIHDGPGIRTSVFLKGCPMNCLWCQNPEGISGRIILWYVHSKCIRCGDCIRVCPENALRAEPGETHFINIDRTLCTNCGDCVRTCPSSALSFIGKVFEHTEVVEELLRDKVFYESSGGGITLTGGEPFRQTGFSRKILEEMKKQGIHTAVETCLLAEREEIESVSPFVDLFLVDMKVFDSKKHAEYTNVPNEKIKDNFTWLAEHHTNIIVRIPVIPGYTDSCENLTRIGTFVAGVDPKIPIELVNFNPLARDKYTVLSEVYPLGNIDSVVPDVRMNELKKTIEAAGAVVVLESEGVSS